MNSEEHIRELLPLYVDEVCTAEEKIYVENHLSACAECRKELEELKTTIRLVKELKPLDASVDVVRQVEEKIRKSSPFKLWGFQPIPAALAVIIILLLGATLHKYSLVYKYCQNEPDIPTAAPVTSPEKDVVTIAPQETSLQKEEAADTVMSAQKVTKEEKAGRTAAVAKKRAPKSPAPPSSYLVEMEVDNTENGIQALRNLAENYRVKSNQGPENDVFLEIQGQSFGEFMNELQHIGKVSYGLPSEEKMEESTAPAHSSASRLIRIKFNKNR